MRIHRRKALALLASTIAVGNAAAAPAELRKVRVGKAIISSFPFSGLELGVQQGFWKALGLDVEVSTFAGDGRLQQALTAGSLDFGFGSGPGMGYAAKGVPAHAVAVVANRPSNMVLIVTKDVAKVDDLKGKRIGVSTAGSLTDWLARKIAVTRNWKTSDVEIVPMGDMRTRLAAMRRGELSAAVTSLQEAYEIRDNGQGNVLTNFGEFVPNFHTHVIFARDEWINKDPELVRTFLKGWFTIANFMRTHRAEAVKAAVGTMKLSEKVIDESYPTEIGMMSYDGQFDPKAIEVIRASLKDLQILDFVPETAAMYNSKFVPVKLN